MTHTFKKLNSRSGSSMIIAMMFMLICVFVGGSVLVAATVNSGRLNGKRQDQQAILNQRSIISVISKDLTNEEGKLKLRMPISKDNTNTDVISIPADAEGVTRLIYQSAYNAFTFKTHDPLNFQVTYADDSGRESAVECYVSCDTNYNVYIGFTASAQVKLKLSGVLTSDALHWNNGKIVKEGAQA